MQIIEIMFYISMGAINFNMFHAKKEIRNIKSAHSGTDKERRNSALPVIKFKL